MLLASIADELRQLGHVIGWIVRDDCQLQRQVDATAGQILHATKNRGSNIRDLFAIRRAFEDWSPDVIVANDTHAVPLVGMAALFSRAPQPLRLAYKHTVFPMHSPLKYRLLCDQVVCVSDAALATVVDSGLSARHAVVVRGGCTPVESDPSARVAVRQEFGLTEDQELLVCVGSLLECKGHRDLLEAVAKLRDSHSNIVVLVAGEGEQRSCLERLIQSHGLADRFRLVGFRDDAQRLLDAADLIVHPSHAEGLSLVLIQAQMLRKPIVATAVGGASEVLAADLAACTAWIAQAQNADALAAKIAQALAVIADPQPEFQSKLHATAERMRNDFSVKSSAKHLAELAARMLAGGGR